jgi:hypothetical protein
MPKKKLPTGKVLKTFKTTGKTRMVTPRPPRPGLVTKTLDLPADLYDAIMVLSEGDDLRYRDRPFASLVRILLADAVKTIAPASAAVGAATPPTTTPRQS